MKIEITNSENTTTTYQALRNLTYIPEVNIVGLEASIDQFEIDIQTTDTIEVGWMARLKIDQEWTYANFYISAVEEYNSDFVHVIAQSELLWLDKKTMPATSYSDIPLSTVISTCTDGTPVQFVCTGIDLNSRTIEGFAPKQTARERILWALFVHGLFVRCGYAEHPEILSADVNAVYMKYEHIFYKPTVTYRDWVTTIKVTAFGFGTPTGESGEETVTDANGDTYKVTRYEHTVSNTSAPATAPENPVEVTDCMLVSRSNVGDILTRLASYYFNRLEVDLDCINNRVDYLPGRKYVTYLDEDTMITGWCESCGYQQGLQTRSTLHLAGGAEISTGKLIITYMSADDPPGTMIIGKRTYSFPEGYGYTVDNPWIDVVIGNYKYFFRPATAQATGTMGSGTTTLTVQCYVCLRLNRKTGVLEVISVDSVERVGATEDESTIYIAEVS